MSFQIPYQMQQGFQTSMWVNPEFPIHGEVVGRSQQIYAWHVRSYNQYYRNTMSWYEYYIHQDGIPSCRFSSAKVRMKYWLLISSSTACTAVVPGSYGRSRGGSCPYTISKGVSRVEECSEVLYAHSAKASQLAQSLGLSLVKHLRYPSNHLFIYLCLPVCLRVICGTH